MPTSATTTSRSMRITREYATYGGAKPLQPKSLSDVAPKLPKMHRAESATATTPRDVETSASEWRPREVVAKALVAAGRTTISKPVRRLAAAIASSGAAVPGTLRVIFSSSVDDAAISIAIAAADNATADVVRRVLVLVPDSMSALVGSAVDKVRGVFVDVASTVVGIVDTEAALKMSLSQFKQAKNIIATGTAYKALMDRVATTGTKARVFADAAAADSAFAVTAICDIAAEADAVLHNFAVAAHASKAANRGRLVIAAPTTRAAATACPVTAPRQAASVAPSEPVTVSLFKVEGVHKFNLLHQLITTSGRRHGIVVRFATKEIASYYCDALYALDVDATILCDVPQDEAVDEADTDAGASASAPTVPSASDASRRGLPPQHHIDNVARSFSASVKAGKGAVLLTAYGMDAIEGCGILLHYDAPTDADSAAAAMLAAPKVKHVMFVDPHCASGAIALVKYAGKARGGAIRIEQLPLPAAGSSALQSMKLKSITAKIFTLANKAFAAYRAYMHYYSLLRPTDTYEVRKLDLDLTASQYGLEEAPLLDLRTKANQFRPREDYAKASQRRLRHDRRETRLRMTDAEDDEATAAAAATAPTVDA